MPKVEKHKPRQRTRQSKLKVCAYARVSSEKDEAENSLINQIETYTERIQRNRKWEFVGVYADKAFTGTKDNRKNFQEMLRKAENGEIDLILTKSLSRFGRNTLDILRHVRTLKAKGVAVEFEAENINTLSEKGEVLLTLLSNYAQEMSKQASDAALWRIRNDFEKGIPTCAKTLGYEWKDGELLINPDEAKIVRQIFKLYLEGMGSKKISNITGIGPKAVLYALENERYVGDLLLQKYYTLDHISKKSIRNRGDADCWTVENHHESIISREDFSRVKAIREGRQTKQKPLEAHSLKGKIQCGACGRNYKRMRGYKKPYWTCTSVSDKWCHNKQIREDIIEELTEGITVENIVVHDDKVIINDQIQKEWQPKSRAESWTPEMKKKASEQNAKNKTESN